MLLTRVQKEEKIIRASQNLAESEAVILVNYSGLKVQEINKLKESLMEQGIGFEVTKNSLFKIALKKANIVIDNDLFNQPIAIVWGKTDEVMPSKLVVNFGKEAESLKIIGGILHNEYSDESVIKQLASLPGREELYAKLVGSLNAPMYRLVNALQGNLRGLVSILDQYKQQKI